MRKDKPEKSRAEPPPPQNKWVVAAGGFGVIIVASAWVGLSNFTWLLFFPLLAIAFVPLFWFSRRELAKENPASSPTIGLPAVAALVLAIPFALIGVAPADLVNRLSVVEPAAVTVRVLNVEQKEVPISGRSRRKVPHYTLGLEGRDREIVLRSHEEPPRYRAGETISICGYRGLLGLPVYGLPPCNQTMILE